MNSSIHTLWQHKNFQRLWAAQTLSELGAKITLLAVPLIATQSLGATPFQMGVIVAAETVPYLLFGLIIGGWVDRLAKRKVMIAADLVRAALLLLVPLAAWAGCLSVEILCVIAFLCGTAEVWFNVASAAYIPIIVARPSLIDANSKLAISSSGAEAIGPTVAGALIQFASAPAAIMGNSLSYFLSALLIGTGKPVAEQPGPGSDETGPSIWADIRAGVSFVFSDTILRAITVRLALWQFIVGLVQALFIYFAVHELMFSTLAVGSLFSLMGLGVLSGAMLAGPISERFGIGPSILFAVTAGAGFALLIPLADGGMMTRMAIIGIALFGYGICTTVYEVNNVTLRQALTPTFMLGRMTSTIRMSTLGLRPLGAVIGGAAGEVVGSRETLLIALAAGLFMSGFSLWVSPLRSVKHAHTLFNS